MKNFMLVILTLLLTGCGVTEQWGRNCGGDLKELCHNVFGGRVDADQDSIDVRHDSEIDELKRRVSQLEVEVNLSKAQMTILGDALSTQGGNLQGQIDALSSSISMLQATDMALQARLSGIDSEISNLTDAVALLQASTAALQLETSTLVLNVNGLASGLAQLNALNAYVNNLANQGAAAYIQLNSAISALQNQMTIVQGDLITLSSNMTTLQSVSNAATIQLAALAGYKHITSIKDPCGPQGNWNEIFLRLSDGSYIASFSEQANGKNTRFVVLQDGNYVTTDGTNCHFTVSGSGTVISNEHN